MDWKTWTKISAVILFIIAVTGFYLNNFYSEGAVLEIQNIPSSSELGRLKASEDYTFIFSLYNTGDSTAFVDIISVSTDPKLITEIHPSSLSIEEKQIEKKDTPKKKKKKKNTQNFFLGRKVSLSNCTHAMASLERLQSQEYS